MEFYYFNNHFTTIMQGCHNSARLQTPCTNCHNLVTTLSQPYKVAARLLQPSYFHMGWVAQECFYPALDLFLAMRVTYVHDFDITKDKEINKVQSFKKSSELFHYPRIK